MAARNPLDIPEILFLVGKYIPLWHFNPPGTLYAFQPRDMLSCTQVSRLFRITMLPILWYIVDENIMTTVPIDIIRKYTPYIRIHLNYGLRSDFPTDNRPFCTELIHLSFAEKVEKDHHVELIKSNPGLKNLKGSFSSDFSTHYGDTFENLKELEDFQCILDRGDNTSYQQFFRPIAPTLRTMKLLAKSTTLNLDGLVFPKLKELTVDLFNEHEARILLQGSPNLESLTSSHFYSNKLIRVIKTGACPALKSLKVGMNDQDQDGVAEMLEGRVGFQSLELSFGKFSGRLTAAISHHASSLTHLSLYKMRYGVMWGPSDSQHLHQILGTCGQLKDVVLGLVIDVIKVLMTADHWKNPNALERLSMGTMGALESYIDRKTDEYVNGWRLPTGIMSRAHNIKFLKAIFEAAEGFSCLRTITMDGVVYEKARPTTAGW
ncbi:MAG: hypothetical protein J3Q66DRAFT_330543 [Benniella sp.]|nr:MAG: hypothetical protein J3Q66DRAFT_330543 [Benniella sp.]